MIGTYPQTSVSYLELSRVSYCLALSGKPDEWGNTYDVNTYDKQEGTDPNGGSYWYQRIMHYNEFYNKNPELIVKNHKYTIDKRNPLFVSRQLLGDV